MFMSFTFAIQVAWNVERNIRMKIEYHRQKQPS